MLEYFRDKRQTKCDNASDGMVRVSMKLTCHDK
jgi:hypothetical protein